MGLKQMMRPIKDKKKEYKRMGRWKEDKIIFIFKYVLDKY